MRKEFIKISKELMKIVICYLFKQILNKIIFDLIQIEIDTNCYSQSLSSIISILIPGAYARLVHGFG